VEGLHDKLEAARNESGKLRARLAERWAERLGGEAEVIGAIPDGAPALLQLVAERLLRHADLGVLAAPQREGTDLLGARARGAIDGGELLRGTASAAGGRGGGRAGHARGRLPRAIDPSDWPAIVAAAR